MANCHLFSPLRRIKKCLSCRSAKYSKIFPTCITEVLICFLAIFWRILIPYAKIDNFNTNINSSVLSLEFSSNNLFSEYQVMLQYSLPRPSLDGERGIHIKITSTFCLHAKQVNADSHSYAISSVVIFSLTQRGTNF